MSPKGSYSQVDLEVGIELSPGGTRVGGHSIVIHNLIDMHSMRSRVTHFRDQCRREFPLYEYVPALVVAPLEIFGERCGADRWQTRSQRCGR